MARREFKGLEAGLLSFVLVRRGLHRARDNIVAFAQIIHESSREIPPS